MKKIFCALLALTLLLSLVGCKKDDAQGQAGQTQVPAPTTEEIYDGTYNESELVIDDTPFVADTESVGGLCEAIYLIVPTPFLVEELKFRDCYDLETLTYYTGITEERVIYEWALFEAKASQEVSDPSTIPEEENQEGAAQDLPLQVNNSTIAYRMMAIRVEEGQDASQVAQRIFKDMRRDAWGGAATDVLVAAQDDVILLIMVDPKYAENGLTGDAVLKAFESVRCYTANVVLK